MPWRLLDTNIISYKVKRHPLRHRYHVHLYGYQLAVSFQTVGELEAGALLSNWGLRRRNELAEQLSICTVLDSNELIVLRYAEVRVARRQQPISAQDAWIAATALAYDLELVTHDAGDFAGIPGLRIITQTS
jgi:tRNA(fMet)-specific endonuclease VapC